MVALSMPSPPKSDELPAVPGARVSSPPATGTRDASTFP
jgi:hypothetical protein